MKSMQPITYLELRKLGENCGSNCLGCKHSGKSEYSDFSLSEEQQELIDKLQEIFSTTTLGVEKILLNLNINYPLSKISLKEIDTILLKNLKIHKSHDFSIQLCDSLVDMSLNKNSILKKLEFLLGKIETFNGMCLKVATSSGQINELEASSKSIVNIVPNILKLIELIKNPKGKKITFQIGRFFIGGKQLHKNKSKVDDVISIISSSLTQKGYINSINTDESTNSYEKNILIETKGGLKFEIHLLITKQPHPKYEEVVRNINNPFSISTFNDHIQVCHSLGRGNDKDNKLTYLEFQEILLEVEKYKAKIIEILPKKPLTHNFLEKINKNPYLSIIFHKLLYSYRALYNISLSKSILKNSDFNNTMKEASNFSPTLCEGDGKLIKIDNNNYLLIILGIYLRLITSDKLREKYPRKENSPL